MYQSLVLVLSSDQLGRGNNWCTPCTVWPQRYRSGRYTVPLDQTFTLDAWRQVSTMLQFANAVPLVATCNIVDTAGHDHITVVDTVIRHHVHVTNKNGLFHLTVCSGWTPDSIRSALGNHDRLAALSSYADVDLNDKTQLYGVWAAVLEAESAARASR